MPEDTFFDDVLVSFPAGSDPSPLIKLRITYPVPLHVAVGSRAHISQLEDAWTEAGVYVLLDRPAADGIWGCYVGKSAASGGVKGRLGAHVQDRGKTTWYRAVAVRPDGTGWDEAQVTWLEGHLHRFLSGASGVSLSNTQSPGTGRLSESRQRPLRHVEEVLNGVLALIGHPVGDSSASPESQPERLGTGQSGTRRQRTPTRRATVADLLEAGLLTEGDKLIPIDPRWQGEGTVTADGGIRVERTTHMAPSPAAEALSGRKSESGWEFWAVGSAQGTTLESLRARLEPGESPTPTDQPPTTMPSVSTNTTTEVMPEAHDLLGQMMKAGLVPAGTRIFSTSKKWPGEGRIRRDGRIEVAGGVFAALSPAGSAITGTDVNGWKFWAVGSPDGETLEALRERFRRGETAS